MFNQDPSSWVLTQDEVSLDSDEDSRLSVGAPGVRSGDTEPGSDGAKVASRLANGRWSAEAVDGDDGSHGSESTEESKPEWDWILHCNKFQRLLLDRKDSGQIMSRVTKTSSVVPHGNVCISTCTIVTNPKQFLEAGMPLGGIALDKSVEKRFPVDTSAMARMAEQGKTQVSWKHALPKDNRACYRFSYYGGVLFRMRLDILDVERSSVRRPYLVACAAAELDKEHPIVCSPMEEAHHVLVEGYGPGLMDGEIEEIARDDTDFASMLMEGHGAVEEALSLA